jgi:hypothetical protein
MGNSEGNIEDQLCLEDKKGKVGQEGILMNSKTYDIVTVGGGLGGAALAKAMAEQGHGYLSWRQRVNFETGFGENQCFPGVLPRLLS